MSWDSGWFPDISVEKWSERTGAEPVESTCEKCKEPIILNIPYKQGNWEGFTSNHTECGNNYRQFCAALPKNFLSDD